MTSKVSPKSRRTTLVPVTVMEEVPVLDAAERKALIKSLEEAEERAKAGQATKFDPVAFERRLLSIYRKARRAKRP